MRGSDWSGGSGDGVDSAFLRALLAGLQMLRRTSSHTGARERREQRAASVTVDVRRPGQADAQRRLEAIVYELLDAHQTTARLADELDWDPDWLEHLERLRRLQRVSREALSAAAAPELIADQAR